MDDALGLLDADVDVALLDRRMPGATGDEVLEQMYERGDDCPTAFTSAVELGLDVLDLAFDDYVVRPTDRESVTRLAATLVALDTCETPVREYDRLTAKRDAVRPHVPRETLAASRTYGTVCDRCETLDERIDSAGLEANAVGAATLDRFDAQNDQFND